MIGKILAVGVVALIVLSMIGYAAWNRKSEGPPTGATNVLEFSAKTGEGKELQLSHYEGQVLLIVNTASECGYTPQYSGLEQLYRKYKDKGLRILAFPSNDFGGQEPGTDEEIKEFCSSKYDVSFDIFSKIEVKGAKKHPLYKYLTEESPLVGEVKWNFNKYLINRHGEVVAKFGSKTEPMSDELVLQVEKLLKEQVE